MTASAGAWYRVGTVNVTGGSQYVTGVGTNWQNDVISIAIGDIFTLDAKTWYEVTAVNSDTNITLDRDFEGVTLNGQSYAIVRNTSGTILTRIAGQISVQFNQKQLFLDELRTWLNSDNASEPLTDSHGVKQSLKTPAQMVRDHDDKLAALDAIHPYPWAMRKVEFEARRAANTEKFAASGFVHFGKEYAYPNVSVPINSGLYSRITSDTLNALWLGRAINGSGISKLDFPKINFNGVLVNFKGHHEGFSQPSVALKFPPAEDGTRTYDRASGVSVTHATAAIAFASETETNKVVTDRVDMWGFEFFLREINDADPFVYKCGYIQSQANNINGVNTVLDNVRPASYFAWYEGDTTSRGRGVNWQAATESQRIAIASDSESNIYFDDETGKFYQGCVRGRSFAGLANGDWSSIELSNSGFELRCSSSAASRVTVQGIKDSVPTYATTQPYIPFNSENTFLAKSHDDPAIFYARDIADNQGKAVNGECYFLVCGTISRLNKGVYHPSFNPLGAAWTYDTTSPNKSKRRKWFERETNAYQITSKMEAFTEKCSASIGSGSFQSNSEAQHRPDGRVYDAIYPNGPGGVCRDMRYPARELTPKDFTENDLKIKNGKYRGHEQLKFAKVIEETEAVGLDSGAFPSLRYFSTYLLNLELSLKEGDFYFVVNKINNEIFDSRNYPQFFSAAGSADNVYFPSSWGASPDVYIIHHFSFGTSVGGAFIHAEVVGNPSEILLCEALSNGWVGSWNPTLPDGTMKQYPLSKKALTSTLFVTSSPDSGETWSYSERSDVSTEANRIQSSHNPNDLVIYYYSTAATLTKKSSKSPLFNEDGSGKSVYFTTRNEVLVGNLLAMSLIGKALLSNNSAMENFGNLSVLEFHIAHDGYFLGEDKYPFKHSAFMDVAPNNNSPPLKAQRQPITVNTVSNINGTIKKRPHKM